MSKDWRDSAMIGLPIAGIIIVGILTIKLPHLDKVISTNTKPSNSNTSSNISDNNISTNKPVSSPLKSSPSNQISNSQISPEEAVIEQYSLINNQQYQDAWNRLAPQLRNNKAIFSNGYNSYESWWKTVKKIEVRNLKSIDDDNKQAIVRVDLTYYMQNGKVASESRNINLSWNNEAENWLVVTANKIN
jgi:serine/threonine protein kinase, bacterial